MTYEPQTGLHADLPDGRDLAYRDILGASPLDIDWDKGFNVYEELGIDPDTVDQGGRLSCVAEGTAMHLRAWWKKLTGEVKRFSRRFIYAHIALPGGGAMLRDGVKLVATKGCPLEEMLPADDAAGFPIGEEAMKDMAAVTPEILAAAVKFDKFGYRMIDGKTDSMDVFAHAILNNCGAVGGFTGSNPGWTCPVCRHPVAGESKWGHGIFLPAFGKTDVAEGGIPVGTRGIFFRNSWGGRYTFKTGRWKGYQMLTEDYFTAGEQTAAGYASGIYVFNAWTLVPDEQIPDSIKTMDFIKKNEGRIIQQLIDAPGAKADGSIALILDGRVLEVKQERAGLAALTAYGRKMQQVIVPVDKKTWDALPKTFF